MLCNNATQFIIIYDQNERKRLSVNAEAEEIILDIQGKIANILQRDES